MRQRNPEQRSSARKRGYGSAWDKARVGFLRLHPHCSACGREGLIVRATVVDHVVPHRGDQRLFWDASNWQALCTNHHSSWKQQREIRGYSSRVTATGLPVDSDHPFYAGSNDEQPASPRFHRLRPARQPITGQREGGPKVIDRRGAGPSGDRRAELVFEPEGLSEGGSARPRTSGNRASGSGCMAQLPSISASPALNRGFRHG